MKHLLKPFLLTIAIGFALSSPSVQASDTRDQTLTSIEAQVAQLPPLPSVKLPALKAALQGTNWADISRGVIDRDAYQCSSTPLQDWFSAQIPDTETVMGLLFMSFLGALDMPTYDALLYGEQSRDNRFGLNGEYTQRLTSQYKDLEKFWDRYPANQQLLPMHGAQTFSDFDHVVELYQVVHGLSPSDAALYAETVKRIMDAYPQLRGGDHPMFTFNAFAFGGNSELGISPRIVMGDGILQGMAAIGLGDVGPRAILGHEFGHTIQTAGGLFDNTDLTGPEATRRTELMADTFSLYYLTHARGEALNAKRLLPSVQSFYQVGDCSFTDDSHHGTPNQRVASSQWAADLANGARPQGHIAPSLDLAARFDAKLPDLVAPDAP